MTPPVGFRRAIPLTVKLEVVLKTDGMCGACGLRLGDLKNVEFDHVPALQLRQWNAEAGDTLPAANDPAYITAKHKECHALKTTGRKGESKLSRVGGDTSEIAKLRRLEAKAQEFRSRLLAKDGATQEPAQPAKRKYQWPKRKFGR